MNAADPSVAVAPLPRPGDEKGMRRLAETLIAPEAKEPFGVYVFQTEEPGAALGRHAEYAVFSEAFGDTIESLTEQYRPYEQVSFFICVVDHLRRLPVGVMRVLFPSPLGLKDLKEMESIWGVSADELLERNGIPLDPLKTWDVAMLGILPNYRARATGGAVVMGLFQALGVCAHACDIDWFVAILSMPAFRMVRWKLHMIFAGFDGLAPKQHQGSPASMPAWCDVKAAAKRLADTDPDLYRILVEGAGLEPVMRPVDPAAVELLHARHLQAVARVTGVTPAQDAAAGFLAS